MNWKKAKISIVTPTFFRPAEIVELLENLSKQTVLPFELIIVDGAPPDEIETEKAVKNAIEILPFTVKYVRQTGGTAIQRNAGIDLAGGNFIALIDDDIRLEPDFLEKMMVGFEQDNSKSVGAITGFITNQNFDGENSLRWKWYRKLHLLTTFIPGHYDYQTGIPINRYMQPPHAALREIHCMGAGCAVWRREVFDSGLRFSKFFADYGMLEDAHLALSAGKKWKLLENGAAHCLHLHSPKGRVNRKRIGFKCVVNYYFVFLDIVGPLTIRQKFRFWRYQAFEFLRIGTSAIRRRRLGDVQEFIGRIEGVFAVLRGAARLKN